MSLPTENEILAMNLEIIKNIPLEGTMDNDAALEQLDRYMRSKQPMIIKTSKFDAIGAGEYVLVPCISPDFVIFHSSSVLSLANFCAQNELNFIPTVEIN